MVNCAKCNADLGDHTKQAGSITLELIGNEHIHSYWFCKACDVYSRMHFADTFLGPEETFGPTLIKKEEAERILKLIAECPDPDNKRCECKAHCKLM